MIPENRPPPKVLFIHNGAGYEEHVKRLVDAGLAVAHTHNESAVAEAARLQPDIILLDFAFDGETTESLKSHFETKAIPVIALVDFLPPR